MFQASSCPSSGATTTAVAASGLPSERGGSSAVGRGLPDHDQNAAITDFVFHCLVLGQNIFFEQLPIMASSCMEHKSDENSQENKGVFREKCNQLPSCSLQFLLLWMQIPAHPLRSQLLNPRTMEKHRRDCVFLVRLRILL